MLEHLNCIALRTVRYNDRNSILTVYTRQHGRLALLLPAGNSRQATRLRALAMPLGRFACVVDMRPGRDIFAMQQVRLEPTATGIGIPSPVKATISLFLADLLAALLREPQQDEALFQFITEAVAALATAQGTALANFHIAFLMQLQRYLGIEPDWSTYTPGAVFDLADGIFRPTPPLHNRFLPSDRALAAFTLRRLNFRNARLFAMPREQRNDILDTLLNYYHIHFPTLSALNSIAVLRTTFNF